jgi:hypothetical protein
MKRISLWALPTHMTAAQPMALPTKTITTVDYDAVLVHLQTHGFMVLHVPVEELRINKSDIHEAPAVKCIISAAAIRKWPKINTYRIDATRWLIKLQGESK